MAFNLTPASIISAAGSAVNLLTNTFKIDIVAILDQETLTQVFSEARPVKASIRETAKVMNYPVETGATLSDHRISNPNEIQMMCVINQDFYTSAYQEIRTAWLNATLLSVQAKTGTYNNMIIQDMPHEETPDMYGAVMIAIKMREVIFVAPSTVADQQQLANYEPGNPAYSQNTNKGLLSAATAASGITSYFSVKSLWGL